jgi:hypothetical protein
LSTAAHDPARRILRVPSTWLGRAALLLVVTALAALAFFFLVFFVVIGSLVAGVLFVRWWWLARKLARRQHDAAIEGDYIVVRDEPGADAPRLPPDSKAG